MKKHMILGIAVAAFIIILSLMLYFSIPHKKPIPVSELLKNSESYKGQFVLVQGSPVLLSSVLTKYGKYSFYAIKDATGKISISKDINEFDLDHSIGVVGTLGDVCVHAVANETTGKWACDRKELGIVT